MSRPFATCLVVLGLLAAAPAWARGEATPLKFAPGASSASVQGGAPQGLHAHYTLGARKGQKMKLRVSSTGNNAGIAIFLPGWTFDKDGYPSGKMLAGAGEKEDVSTWNGTLPASGTYLVDIGGRHGGTDYKLTVEIK
ncbi:MAG: hypothetical protein JWM80_4819 [Cyanobacteria bacterium RYN_339]|nr:hypothetical protein [Cyanobacteria bacterium RYN_339]